MLVLPYMPDSPEIVITADTIAAGTIFSGILVDSTVVTVVVIVLHSKVTSTY